MKRKTALQRKPNKLEREAIFLALKLRDIFKTQNAAADICGITRPRMSHIINGNIQEVAITETDVRVMRAIYEYRKLRGKLSIDSAKLLDRLEHEIAEANRANHAINSTISQAVRMLSKV